MRKKRLGPGKKSRERGSTFTSRGGKLSYADRKANPPKRREARQFPGATGWTQRVFTLYGRRCAVCGAAAVHGHHAVPKRTIIARGGEEIAHLVYDARNGVPVCFLCHGRHENAYRRIKRRELPEGVVLWAVEHDFGWYLDNPLIYPPG